MYAGRVVEEGPASDVLRRPRHPYTRGLVASVPDHVHPRRLRGIEGVAVGVGERPPGCAFAPRCPYRVPACDEDVPPLLPVSPSHTARCIRWDELPPLAAAAPARDAGDEAAPEAPLLLVHGLRAEHRTRAGPLVVARGVSFAIQRGRCVALVGESGSGKTTIARCVAGLHPPSGGRIELEGVGLAARAGARTRAQRQLVQIVFQNPDDSLNPRHTVRSSIARPARILLGLDRRAANAEVDALLERVRLPARLADRYPRELSGGERQRVAIARALAARPALVICDEITSALDVSVQAAVLGLLDELRAELGLALLFISHDLGVVASTADHVLVLDRGRVCEEGPPATLLAEPANPYTQALVAAAPTLEPVDG
jgi:peptide/nickel transport system ATP-binding protein